MAAERDIRSWYRQVGDTTYLCSSDPALLQLDAFNAALGSEMLWWARSLSEDSLKKIVDSCLLIALYALKPESPTQPREEAPRVQVGGARVITDWVTFGYLTDVYVLEEYQQKGLGSFMMNCLNEILEDWKDLRGFFILASGEEAAGMYSKCLKADDFFQKNEGTKIKLLEKKGPSNGLVGNPH
ncbi:hypothetical protein NKR23_g3080 [Pleurostoma richardsiae]|uniref:N-acetyltransferase domain-containing protein n=1 Tax=Pleurostoma richardsiae TaxID=41990 RepID=A0AA38VX97_9PEZI|nr:hypothetical protein NKR23_g3080 [Pleurostoma richardsiae]